MRKVIYGITSCPLSNECRNNPCLLRMVKVFGYPLTPSTKHEQDKAKDVEKTVGSKGYVPLMETQLRDGKLQVLCPDFKE